MTIENQYGNRYRQSIANTQWEGHKTFQDSCPLLSCRTAGAEHMGSGHFPYRNSKIHFEFLAHKGSREAFPVSAGAFNQAAKTSLKHKTPKTSKLVKNRSKVGFRGWGLNRSKIGRKCMISCMFDLFYPHPAKHIFDLF